MIPPVKRAIIDPRTGGYTMTQAVLAKICNAKVRRGDVEDCGGKLVLVKDRGLVCENKPNHLNPIISGFCHSGWHEGNKINKPTCKIWVTCPCDCHTVLSRMAMLTGTERVLVDNSTYVPDRGSFVRVSLTEAVTQAAIRDTGARVVPSQAPGIVPDSVERTFAPTESGRAARGQLESWVRQVTDIWVTTMPENCTPKYVAAEIQRMHQLDRSPSQGAVDAVFKRWAEIGFAVLGSKPTRFMWYTPEGIRDGLEALKARAKR